MSAFKSLNFLASALYIFTTLTTLTTPSLGLEPRSQARDASEQPLEVSASTYTDLADELSVQLNCLLQQNTAVGVGNDFPLQVGQIVYVPYECCGNSCSGPVCFQRQECNGQSTTTAPTATGSSLTSVEISSTVSVASNSMTTTAPTSSSTSPSSTSTEPSGTDSSSSTSQSTAASTGGAISSAAAVTIGSVTVTPNPASTETIVLSGNTIVVQATSAVVVGSETIPLEQSSTAITANDISLTIGPAQPSSPSVPSLSGSSSSSSSLPAGSIPSVASVPSSSQSPSSTSVSGLNTQTFTEPNGATTVLTLPTSLVITGATTLVTGDSTLTLGLAPTTTTGTEIEVFTEPDGLTTTLTLDSDVPIIAPTTLVTGGSTLTLYPEPTSSPTSSSSTSSGLLPVIQTLEDPDGDLFTVTQPSITGIETISTSGSSLELAPFVTLFINSPTSTMTTVPPGVTVTAFTEWTASTNGYVTSTVSGSPVVFPVIVPCPTCVPEIIEGWDDILPNVWFKWLKFPQLPTFHIGCIFFCSHPKKNPPPPVNDGPPPSPEGKPSATSSPSSSPNPSSSGSPSSSSASSTSTSSATSSGSSSSSSTSSSTSSASLASTTPDFKGTDPNLVAQVEAYQAPFLDCISTFVLPFPTACDSSNSTASGSSSTSGTSTGSTSQPTTFSTSTITSSPSSIPSFLPMTYSYADPDQGVSSPYCQYSGTDYPASFTTIGTSVNSCAYTAVPSTTIPPQSLSSSGPFFLPMTQAFQDPDQGVTSAYCQYSGLDYPQSFATIGTSVNPCAYTTLPASTIPAPTPVTTTVSSNPSSTAPASATTPTLSTIDPASAAAETGLCFSTTDSSNHVPFSLTDANTAIKDICTGTTSLDANVLASEDFSQYPGDGYTITAVIGWATDQSNCGGLATFDIPNQQYDCAASFEVNTNCMDSGNVIGGVWVLNTGAGCVEVAISAVASSNS